MKHITPNNLTPNNPEFLQQILVMIFSGKLTLIFRWIRTEG